MTGEHGNRCCHHDEQDEQYDTGDHATQAPAATGSAGCCGGGASHDETSPSNQHAQHSETARSSS
jgi:hypothetical protein